MNETDFAIVVGVQRYPSFGRGPGDPNDLQGPDNDVRAVHAWLTDPGGGGLPADNVRCISSAQYPNPFGSPKEVAPKPSHITAAFRWLDGIARRNNRRLDGPGLKVGRRLYLYVGGHGYARQRKEAAVFAANATRRRSWHVEVTRWADWLYQAEYFDEYVVWVDCCMNPDLRIRPGRVGFRDVVPSLSPPLFSAFAARYPLQAVEARMEDGQYHGAFTWALLKGLRSATDETGAVTTETIKAYLVNAMRTFMTDEQVADERVSKEPDFGFDDKIVLARPAETPTFDVVIRLDASAVDRGYRILTGSPPRVAASGTARGRDLRVKLPNGLYVLTIPDVGRSVGIEVTGADRVVQVA